MIGHHLVQFTASPPVHVALAGVLLLLLLAHFALFVGALISVLGSPQSAGMKLVWCVFVFVAPIVGSLAWFLIGRPTTHRGAYDQ